MSEKIIVGVIDANASRRAVDWAASRAVARRQRLELMTVIGGAIGAVGEAAVIASARDAAAEALRAEAERIARDGLVVEVRVESGNPVASLATASKDAALLVIGSDYRGPGSGPARGVHGIRITASAHCPVVVVPDAEPAPGRHGIVVGVDGSPASEGAIAFAAAEADRLDEPLIAVTVWTPVDAPRNAIMVNMSEYRHAMEEAARQSLAVSLAGLRRAYPDLVIDERIAEGYPSVVINGLAEQAVLAVVGTHGRGALRRFLLGSISHEVLQRLATVTAVVR